MINQYLTEHDVVTVIVAITGLAVLILALCDCIAENRANERRKGGDECLGEFGLDHSDHEHRDLEQEQFKRNLRAQQRNDF